MPTQGSDVVINVRKLAEAIHRPCRKVIVASCAACATGFAVPLREYAPGMFMGVMHADHAGELLGLGWDTIEYEDGPDDVVCPHFDGLVNR